jgi:hypothetical protein
MADFLSNLIERTSGRAVVARPAARPIFAPEPASTANFPTSLTLDDELKEEVADPAIPQTKTSPLTFPTPAVSTAVGQLKGAASSLSRTSPVDVPRPALATRPEASGPSQPAAPEPLARNQAETGPLQPLASSLLGNPGLNPAQPAAPGSAGSQTGGGAFQPTAGVIQTRPVPASRPGLSEPPERRVPLNELAPEEAEGFVLMPTTTAVPSRGNSPAQSASGQTGRPEEGLRPGVGLNREVVPRLAPPALPEPARPEAAPTVEVTIGRVEVRALISPAEVLPVPATPVPRMSLDDYLRQARRDAI